MDDASSSVVRDSDGTVRWWTFAGFRANAWLMDALGPLAEPSARADGIAIRLRSDALETAPLLSRLGVLAGDPADEARVGDEAIEGLKFSACLPKTGGD